MEEINQLKKQRDELDALIIEKTNAFKASQSYTCPHCNEEKDASNFYSYEKLGKVSYFKKCKPCSNKKEKKGSKYSNLTEDMKAEIMEDIKTMKNLKQVAEKHNILPATFYNLHKKGKFLPSNIEQEDEQKRDNSPASGESSE